MVTSRRCQRADRAIGTPTAICCRTTLDEGGARAAEGFRDSVIGTRRRLRRVSALLRRWGLPLSRSTKPDATCRRVISRAAATVEAQLSELGPDRRCLRAEIRRERPEFEQLTGRRTGQQPSLRRRVHDAATCEVRKRARDGWAAGSGEVCQHAVGQAERNAHTVAAHAPPSTCEVPEHHLQPHIDTRMMDDRHADGEIA